MKKALILPALVLALATSCRPGVKLKENNTGKIVEAITPGEKALLAIGAGCEGDVYPSADSTAVMHAYLPAKPTGRAVLCLPGGGYSGLAVDHEGRDWKDFFNAKGIAFFVLEYRMPNGDKSIPTGDAMAALRMVRSHAREWGVNPQDIGIMGSSAGGHLAAITSVMAPIGERPAFQILFYPVISMNLWGSHAGSCFNFMGEDVMNPDSVATYSAQMQVPRHTAPPAIILLSSDDDVVPAAFNGVAYAKAMLDGENPVTLYLYPDGGHGWGFMPEFSHHDEVLESLGSWLDALPSKEKDAVRVACIGDSITDGHRIFPAFKLAYPAVLQHLLGEGYDVRNFGVGARTLQDSGDHPYMDEKAWRECLDFNPSVVVIKLGTNDSKPENWHGREPFGRDLQKMIDRLKTLPSAPRILLCTPVPAWENPYGIDGALIRDEIIPEIQEAASRNGLSVINLHSAVTDSSLFQEDGVHPNPSGDAAIARVVAESILYSMEGGSHSSSFCGTVAGMFAESDR